MCFVFLGALSARISGENRNALSELVNWAMKRGPNDLRASCGTFFFMGSLYNFMRLFTAWPCRRFDDYKVKYLYWPMSCAPLFALSHRVKFYCRFPEDLKPRHTFARQNGLAGAYRTIHVSVPSEIDHAGPLHVQLGSYSRFLSSFVITILYIITR